MPETGYDESYDYDQEPVAQRGDYLVKIPRGAIRHLEAKAAAYDRLAAAGALPTDAAADNLARGLTAEGDTPLEEGEAGLTAERRLLNAGAPPDRGELVDELKPYEAADQIREKHLAAGGTELQGLALAFASIVNQAHRGNQRVIIADPRQQYRGGLER